MRFVLNFLLGMSLLTFMGCATENSIDVAGTSADAPSRDISIEGSGVQLVSLKMPGMH